MVRNMSCVGYGYISDICKNKFKIRIIKTQMHDYVIMHVSINTTTLAS